MKDVFKNKRLWIGIGCGILAVALIVGMVLLALAGGEKNPNPTEGTSDVVTDPTETTGGNGNEVTDPATPATIPNLLMTPMHLSVTLTLMHPYNEQNKRSCPSAGTAV